MLVQECQVTQRLHDTDNLVHEIHQPGQEALGLLVYHKLLTILTHVKGNGAALTWLQSCSHQHVSGHTLGSRLTQHHNLASCAKEHALGLGQTSRWGVLALQ